MTATGGPVGRGYNVVPKYIRTVRKTRRPYLKYQISGYSLRPNLFRH
jgi:hypothetical protein